MFVCLRGNLTYKCPKIRINSSLCYPLKSVQIIRKIRQTKEKLICVKWLCVCSGGRKQSLLIGFSGRSPITILLSPCYLLISQVLMHPQSFARTLVLLSMPRAIAVLSFSWRSIGARVARTHTTSSEQRENFVFQRILYLSSNWSTFLAATSTHCSSP